MRKSRHVIIPLVFAFFSFLHFPAFMPNQQKRRNTLLLKHLLLIPTQRIQMNFIFMKRLDIRGSNP